MSEAQSLLLPLYLNISRFIAEIELANDLYLDTEYIVLLGKARCTLSMQVQFVCTQTFVWAFVMRPEKETHFG